MYSIEEEKVNIILGDALLLLFEQDADIRVQALSAQLMRMLEKETDDARRQVILQAIRETYCFSDSEDSRQDDDAAEDIQSPAQIRSRANKSH
ncbi:hypothetical protein NB703_004286 [Pantoea ananatis]|uniref:Uncharacterized protein n=1 Tax=Pantoea ananas TaxID=553 RepID=A0AAJ1D2U4_PANAN|nr:hypothetical protein [Pantoea ananatis]MCW0346193.1 hypothetical protein [Pantoea ananatis]MCW0350906.1 hypothetical protein [Pantoea ananatis]